MYKYMTNGSRFTIVKGAMVFVLHLFFFIVDQIYAEMREEGKVT